MTAVCPAPQMPPCVRTAFAAAVRVENELTSYELDAAHPWTRHEEAVKAEKSAKDAAMRVEQLGLVLESKPVQPEEQPTTTIGKAREGLSHNAEGDLQLLLRELVRSDAECRRLSAACNALREQAEQAADECARRLQLAEEASASRHAAMEAELTALRRLASEAVASLGAARAQASAAVTEAGSSARRVKELQESVRTLQPIAAAAAITSVQLAEARSKSSALEALARRGAEDSVALLEARNRIRGLERDVTDRRAALGLAEAELAGLREQAVAAATLRAQLEFSNGRAEALHAQLDATAADSADLAVARARIAALEARLETLSYGEPGMARPDAGAPSVSATAVRAEVSVADSGAVRLRLLLAAKADE